MTKGYLLLCALDDIAEGCAKSFTIDGQALLTVKKEDCVYIYRNQCPHLGLPLEWQTDQFLNADHSLIQCATHGALFVIDTGQCIHGPCQGQSLEAVPSQVIDNGIYVLLRE